MSYQITLYQGVTVFIFNFNTFKCTVYNINQILVNYIVDLRNN